MTDLIVTIDGPAASGKSTIAQLLAEKLNASFLDTGAMYRAVTLAAIQAAVNLESEKEVLGVMADTKFEFTVRNGKMMVSINGVNATDEIRQPHVTANARHIASAADIRGKLVQMQRDFAGCQQRIVTEGRDQGTVAFPDAHFKFFLTAEPAERARRRQAQLRTKGINQDFQQILKAIEVRDKSDQSRNVGPLKPADDAIVVDTTRLSIQQVVNKLLEYIQEK